VFSEVHLYLGLARAGGLFLGLGPASSAGPASLHDQARFIQLLSSLFRVHVSVSEQRKTPLSKIPFSTSAASRQKGCFVPSPK
jgi:hypothetical protein